MNRRRIMSGQPHQGCVFANHFAIFGKDRADCTARTCMHGVHQLHRFDDPDNGIRANRASDLNEGRGTGLRRAVECAGKGSANGSGVILCHCLGRDWFSHVLRVVSEIPFLRPTISIARDAQAETAGLDVERLIAAAIKDRDDISHIFRR
jgi:hypothetical protein